jgi:hypothetical protein
LLLFHAVAGFSPLNANVPRILRRVGFQGTFLSTRSKGN